MELTRQVLQGHVPYLLGKLAKMNTQVKQELGCIVRARSRTSGSGLEDGGDQVLATDLTSMTLEDLAEHVSSRLETLNTAQAGLEKNRSKGLHKVSVKAQKFVSEFDRFLSAYSGIMNVVSLVDAQHGGVACATLALLFAVDIPLHNHLLTTK